MPPCNSLSTTNNPRPTQRSGWKTIIDFQVLICTRVGVAQYDTVSCVARNTKGLAGCLRPRLDKSQSMQFYCHVDIYRVQLLDKCGLKTSDCNGLQYDRQREAHSQSSVSLHRVQNHYSTSTRMVCATDIVHQRGTLTNKIWRLARQTHPVAVR